MFFKRTPNLPPSSPYTSGPPQRTRRQSAPSEPQPAATISSPYCGGASGTAGPSPSPVDGMKSGAGMSRRRSRSVPQLRETVSRVTFGLEIGLGRGKRDGGIRGQASSAGNEARSNKHRSLELVDRMNANARPTGSAIPVRKQIPPSRLPTPTRIPGFASSKSRTTNLNVDPARSLKSQTLQDSCSPRPREGRPPSPMKLFPSDSPRRPPQVPSPPKTPTGYKPPAPPVPTRPWIRGQGTVQSENKVGRPEGCALQEESPVDVTATRSPGDSIRERSSKQTTRPPLPTTKPDPKPLLRELAELLQHDRAEIGGELDVDDMLAMHERDVMDRAGREEWVDKHEEGEGVEGGEGLTVFATPVRQVYIYASTRTAFRTSSGLMPGWQLDLPIVVVSCVEELWRRGAFDIEHYASLGGTVRNSESGETVLASTPNDQHLVDIFNSQRTAFGASFSLSPPETEYGQLQASDVPPNTQEIIQLLQTYLSSLPEPIVPPALASAGWAWCVSSPENNAGDAERHVHVARILLRLLPTPNFALLVYMLAFLRQVVRSATGDTGPTVTEHTEKHVGWRRDESAARAVGKVFGGWVFGYGDDGMRGEEMVVWFLLRWEKICRGLFDVGLESGQLLNVPQEAGGGSTPRPTVATSGRNEHDRPHDELDRISPVVPWMPRDAPGDFFGSSPSMDSAEDLLFGGRAGLSAWTDRHQRGTGDARGLEEQPPLPHEELPETTTADENSSVILTPSQGLFEMDKLSLMRATPSPGPSVATDAGSARRFSGTLRVDQDSDMKSVLSIVSEPALEERLMDVSFLPDLESSLDVRLRGYATLPGTPRRGRSIALSNVTSGTPSRSSTLTSNNPSETSATSADDSRSNSVDIGHLKLSQAEAKIKVLEHELDRRDVAVANATEEMSKARERIVVLETRVRELEHGKDSGNARTASGEEAIKEMEERFGERDEALELMKIARQVITEGERSSSDMYPHI